MIIRTLVMILATATAAFAAEEPPLRQVATIPLGDVKGRIDHMSLDAAGGRLFVAALGNNSVEVINLAAGKVTQSLGGMTEPQGVRFLPDAKQLVVASGGDGKIRFYDDALKLIHTIDNLDDADNVRYDAAAKRVYVGYGTGALAVCAAGKLLDTIKLSGHPESFQLEPKGSRIFVNVPSTRKIEVVDRNEKRVIAQWAVKGAEANFPMALDDVNHRLLVVCRKPPKLLAYDTDTGEPLAATDVCGDADDIWLDGAADRIYVTGGEGSISVIDQVDPDHYRVAATIPTAKGARTSIFDVDTRRLYVGVPQRDGQRPQIRVYEPPPLRTGK